MKLNILHIAILFILISCNKEEAPDCFTATGPDETETRELEPFHRVEINDYIQVKFVNDSTGYFVRITGGKNLLDKIVTDVEGDVLKIDNENTCRFVRSFKRKIIVEVHSSGISEIINYGQGDISCKNQLMATNLFYEQNHGAGRTELNVQADSVSVICHTGVGDVYLQGEAASAGFFNGGYGLIDASALQAEKAFVNNSSINDVYVNFESYLFALITKSGNIYYQGPLSFADVNIEGDGELLPIP